IELPVRRPRLIDFDTFGFMEFVQSAECTNKEAVLRCYRRYGALLGLAHGLGTSDLHHENVIVSGEHPIVIDAETILKARLSLSDLGQRRLEFETQLSLGGLDARESILETAMLPITWLLPPLDKLDSWQETRIG